MFWPVTSSARCWAYSAEVAVFRPENVLTAAAPRCWSRCSHRTVQGDRSVGVARGPAAVGVGAGRGGADAQQRVADGGQAAVDELLVGRGERAQLGDQHQQAL